MNNNKILEEAKSLLCQIKRSLLVASESNHQFSLQHRQAIELLNTFECTDSRSHALDLIKGDNGGKVIGTNCSL